MYNNQKYVFASLNSETVIALKAWLIEYDDENYQINHLKANDNNTYEENAPVGTMIYNAINGKYIRMECENVPLEIEKTNNKNWYKIKGKNEYILKNDCDNIIKDFKDDIKFNDVQNVDIPIEAGTFVGKTSLYGVENGVQNTIVHLEVFSDDSTLNDFINNTTDNDKTSYQVEEGKTLQIAKPCNFLKQNTKVKIYQQKDNYTQIGFEDVFVDAINSVEIAYKGKKNVYINGHKTSRDTYAIKEDKFTDINTKLNNLLPNKDVLLYWAGKPSASIRKVGYGTKNSGHKYWVNSYEVTGNIDDWVTLTSDITAFFEEEPSLATTDIIIDKTTKIFKKASTKDNNKVEWWKISAKENKGWIKKSELTEKNPYNWKDFGWKIIENTGDQYFYMFGEFVEKNEPHEFINNIWDIADTDDDKILSNFELQQAMRDKEKLIKISHLIPKHQNEWDTWQNFSKFENEFIQVHKKGIDEEEDTNKKQELEKQRDDKLAVLKAKIENLCFWDKIQTGDLVPVAKRKQEYIDKHKPSGISMLPNGTSEEEICLANEFDAMENERISRYFPKSSEVYHFHPIAFIEQMKMIITKEDIDLSNKVTWMSQFNEDEKGKRDGCWRTCYKILISSGLPKYSGYNINVIQTIKEDSLKKTFNITSKANLKKGIKYINLELEKNNPIIVGLHYKYGYKGNTDNTTDHFVVIIGRGYENGNLFFRYYEVGTKYPNKGQNIKNRLYLQEDNTIRGGKYIVSQIRMNK